MAQDGNTGAEHRGGRRSLSIDALRILATAIVIISHYQMVPNFPLGGTVGVVLFFMISGYCMSYSTEGRTGGQFLVARIRRLVPALVLCATITMAIEAALPGIVPDRTQSLGEYVNNLKCLWNGNVLCDAYNLIRHGGARPYVLVDGAYWSLLVEFRFYLLLWLLFYLLKIRDVALVIALIGFTASLNMSTIYISKSEDFLLYLSFFSFGLGVRRWIDGDQRAFLSLAASVAAFASNCAFGSIGLSMALAPQTALPYALCFAVFPLALIALNGRSSTSVAQIGILTYPIYLLHQDIGYIVIASLEGSIGSLTAKFSALALVFGLAILVQSAAEMILRTLSTKRRELKQG
jgi:peptidoglycan/LPS O-acetylase OafA/YrhL